MLLQKSESGFCTTTAQTQREVLILRFVSCFSDLKQHSQAGAWRNRVRHTDSDVQRKKGGDLA